MQIAQKTKQNPKKIGFKAKILIKRILFCLSFVKINEKMYLCGNI